MSAFGERFRAAREARGLSLSDVAEQIRIRSVYLGAIEDGNWSAIGAPVYIRGFLRTYGRFLGLDTEEIVAEFNGEASTPVAPAPGTQGKTNYFAEDVPPPRQLSPLTWIAAIVAVALIAYVVYSAMTLHQRSSEVAALPSNSSSALASAMPSPSAGASSPSASPAASDSTSPSPGTSESPAASPSPLGASPQVSASPGADGPNTLDVRLTSASWVRVTVDGNVSMEGTFPAGTARRFHGKLAVLRIGNAGGVVVLVDGKDVGKLGGAGDVVERSFTL